MQSYAICNDNHNIFYADTRASALDTLEGLQVITLNVTKIAKYSKLRVKAWHTYYDAC